MPQDKQLRVIERFDSEEQLKDYLVEDALKKYSTQFGKVVGFPWWLNKTIELDLSKLSVAQLATADADAFAFGESALAEVGTDDFSDTNTQEEGVDEADLIETDGEYIYQVADRSLTIVDARNPKRLNVASQMDLSDLGNIRGAYLYEDKLTVISTSSPWYYSSIGSFFYNPIPYNPTVNVTVLDVSDPTSVELEETSRLDGTLLSSRAISDQVYVVTEASFGLPGPVRTFDYSPPTKPVPVDLSQKVVASEISFAPSYPYPLPTYKYKYETKEQYLARIEGRELDLALANFTTVDDKGKILRKGLLSEAQNIYKPLDDKKPFNLTLASVSVFDVDDGQPGPNSSTGIPDNNLEEVYMSLDNLYLLGGNWGQPSLLKVDLDTLELVAVGEVPGRVLDQFSVSEHNQFLRVATTSRFGRVSKNNLYVLEQEGQEMRIVGSIEDIAPGETIRSARFQGDYGFLVTFRQVDPFFTLDLSEPTNPQVAGELKLPGFSEYLQVIENEDKTQVLGIGRDADLLGRARGLKVSLFDVTDFENPQEVDSFLFEGKYSSSEARWDHRAVSYFPASDTLAIPYQTSGQQGLRVFDVDAEDGFKVRGNIEHEGGRIRRSLRIGDDLYAISDERITVHDLATLDLVDEVVWSGSDGKENPFLAVGSLEVFTEPVPVVDALVTDSGILA